MSKKINIFPVLFRHNQVFRDAAKKNLSFFDFFTFYFCPVAFGYFFRTSLTADLINKLTTFVTVIIGFLVSGLALLFVLNESIRRNHNQFPNANIDNEISVLKETSVSIIYSALMGCILTVFLIANSIESKICSQSCDALGNTVVLTMSFHFFLLFLMILKRLFIMTTVMIEKEI